MSCCALFRAGVRETNVLERPRKNGADDGGEPNGDEGAGNENAG